MARGPALEFTPNTRGRIMGEYNKKVSLGAITNLKKHQAMYGHLKPLPRSGCPRVTTPKDEKHMVSLIDRQKARNAADLYRNYYQCLSLTTIRRVLKSHGLGAYRPKKVPFLTKFHRRVQRVWTAMCQRWDFHMWKRAIFSDESKFNLLRSDGREFVWRRKGDGYKPKYTLKTQKFGGGKVVVWGCLTSMGVDQLHHITSIMDCHVYIQVLRESLLGTLRNYGMNPRHVIFQQDNNPKHTLRAARAWIAKKGFMVLPWPAQSPDLNPIENVWDHLARKGAKRELQPATKDQLWEALQEEWYGIDPMFVQKLYEGMQKRVMLVAQKKGWNIPY
ncbi:hypothetical protein PsYK624_052660 [Phanerochaete sordida]|uniref:Tc1-like transposase DDE domain-containing protein n=1 Tax=Phanerochaete sordida TaxID=48140 RepID=A0A9P3LB69_9APHY|nr:hypothetical protein PsYK624_052660 [Phanerochaete sordida]